MENKNNRAFFYKKDKETSGDVATLFENYLLVKLTQKHDFFLICQKKKKDGIKLLLPFVAFELSQKQI